MQVAEVMSKRVATIDADASLEQAAEEMRERNIGVLPVIEGNAVTGIITDRDMVVRAMAAHRDPQRTRVKEVMSHNPVIVHERAPVEQATDILADRKIGRVLVVDDNSQVVGLLSMGDIALASDNKEMVGDLLKRISTRYT